MHLRWEAEKPFGQEAGLFADMDKIPFGYGPTTKRGAANGGLINYLFGAGEHRSPKAQIKPSIKTTTIVPGEATIVCDARFPSGSGKSCSSHKRGDRAMKRKLLTAAVLAFAVVPAIAQTTADQADQAKSAAKQYQQQYNESINSESGRIGKDEPGARLLPKEGRQVPEKGIAVEPAGRASNAPSRPNDTTGQRP